MVLVMVMVVECGVGRTCGDGGVMEPGADIQHILRHLAGPTHSQHRAGTSNFDSAKHHK